MLSESFISEIGLQKLEENWYQMTRYNDAEIRQKMPNGYYVTKRRGLHSLEIEFVKGVKSIETFDVLKKQVEGWKSGEKNHHGFYATVIHLEQIEFVGNRSIQWWDRVAPVAEAAENAGLDVVRMPGIIVIRRKLVNCFD